MNNILRPTLELTVIIPGMILAYLPVKSTLKISLPKLIAWLFPLLIQTTDRYQNLSTCF